MFPFAIGPHHSGYHLDRCEEIVLIDAWLKIRSRIPDDEVWHFDFQDRFFSTDSGVSEKVLESIDRHLKRLRLKTLNFRISGHTPYMKIRRQEKVDARRHIQDDLQTRASTESVVDAARVECGNVPPPISKSEAADDPAVAAQRRKDEALERVRREQEAEAARTRQAEQVAQAAEAERVRQEQEAARAAELERLCQEEAARAAELVQARALVAAADAALTQGKASESRLFGAIEELLLGFAGKLDLLLARSKLANLQINELASRIEAVDGRVAAETERVLEEMAKLAPKMVRIQPYVSPDVDDQPDYESHGHANGRSHLNGHGHPLHHGHGNGHDRNGHDRNGHDRNGHGNGRDHVIYSTPGGYGGDRG